MATVEPDGTVRGGRHGMMLLKTRGSAFTKFARDEYTTLPERGDRPLLIRLDADWATPPTTTSTPRPSATTSPPRSTTSSRSRSSTSSTRWARGWPADEISRVSFTAENHTRDPVGEDGGRKVYTDPFPAQGLITLTLP